MGFDLDHWHAKSCPPRGARLNTNSRPIPGRWRLISSRTGRAPRTSSKVAHRSFFRNWQLLTRCVVAPLAATAFIPGHAEFSGPLRIRTSDSAPSRGFGRHQFSSATSGEAPPLTLVITPERMEPPLFSARVGIHLPTNPPPRYSQDAVSSMTPAEVATSPAPSIDSTWCNTGGTLRRRNGASRIHLVPPIQFRIINSVIIPT